MAEIVDLSHDDDELTRANIQLLGATQEEQGTHENYLGHFRTQAVGIRYYQGEVNMWEMVSLDRDRNNQYDGNAIQVNNVQGVKVGHVNREQAAVLAPLLDSNELHIEGLACGPKGKFNLPMLVSCYGPPDPEVHQKVHRILFNHGMHLSTSEPLSAVASSSQAREPGWSLGGRRLPSRPEDTVSREQREEALEKMFEALGMASEVQDMLMPAKEIGSGLYPHQMVALAWMVKRENNDALPPLWEPRKVKDRLDFINTLTNFSQLQRPPAVRGGILADDMGLGKTLSVIALIATNRPGAAPAALLPYKGSLVDGRPISEGGSNSDAAQEPPAKRRKAGDGSSSSSTPCSSKENRQQEEADARAEELATSLEGAPHVPSLNGPKATLILCPPSVMSNWQSQIAEHTAGNLKVYQYHGPERNSSPSFLASHDVVITTYQTLTIDFEASGRRTGPHALEWLRVVLDEAQAIKNPKAKMSHAVRQLKAERRWALSGTPIQNKLLDLFGITSFLDFAPCNNRNIFTRSLERPVKQGKRSAIKNLQVLMGVICMRRTKDMRVGNRPLIALPSKTVSIVEVPLTDQDMQKYTRVEELATQVMSGMLEGQGEALLKNYALVLQFLLRLRQICDAGCLVPDNITDVLGHAAAQAMAARKDNSAPKLSPERVKELQAMVSAAKEEEECPICMNFFDNPVITACAHTFCRACIERALATQDQTSVGPCPMCRCLLTAALDLVDPPAPKQEDNRVEQQQQQQREQTLLGSGSSVDSAKVQALISVLKHNHTTNLAAGSHSPPIKAVVFSQFTTMLDVIGKALSQQGITYFRLDGSVPQKARSLAIQQFSSTSPSSPAVFLISLRAGGVGLNLTAASQVHLLDPWWNSAVEQQAMDRVHRLGQVRDVEVLRYIAKGTIEERILLLQERKEQLKDAAFKRETATQVRKARVNDVKLLLNIPEDM